MKRFRGVLLSIAAVSIVMLSYSSRLRASTPKDDPFSGCTSPPADFQVTIGFDSTNQVPTVNASKNTSCVTAGNNVAFQIDPNANITSWQVNFPTTTPVFTGICQFGTKISSSSQSCTVATNAGQGDYVYQVQVWIGNGGTAYTLDPRVIIRSSGKRRRRRQHAAAASGAANP